MAGESPDRSKQRESSVEPTPGSARPVPEARTPARPAERSGASPAAGPTGGTPRASGKPDPRIAVSGRSGGESDTATRVLPAGRRGKDSPSGAKEAGDGVLTGPDAGRSDSRDARDSEPSPGADSSSEKADATGGPGRPRGSRSDVSSEDAGPDTANSAPEAEAEAETGKSGRSPVAPGAAAEFYSTSALDAVVRSTSAKPPADDALAEAADAADAEPDRADGTGGNAGPDAETRPAEGGDARDGGQKSEAREDRLRAAVSAWVRTADATTAQDRPAAANADGKGRVEDADEGDGDEGDGAAKGDAGDEGPAADQSPGAPDPTTGRSRADSGAGSPPTDRPTAVFEAPAPAGKGTDQPTTALAFDGSGEGGARGADEVADGTPGDERADAEGGPKSASRSERPERTGLGKPVEGAKRPSPRADSGGTEAEGPRPRSDEAEATDLDEADGADGAEGAAPSSGGSGTGGAAESPAERTSKFVALRPLDDPATRKPPTAADVTAVLATTPPATPADADAGVGSADPSDAGGTEGPERTRQQPMPPKPPMDLLAELTNTPPPPETPLRTAARRVKIWTPLALLLVVVFAVVQATRSLPQPRLDLTAPASFTFEGGDPRIPWPESGQAALDVQGIGTFGSSGEQEPVPIASVAKIMTAYVILRDHPLKSGAEGPKIEIDETAEEQSDAGAESTVQVSAGDSITQREAVESILVASANNVARLLARWDAGSEEAFVEKMNEAAEDLGMSDSTYTDPSGLNDSTVSTAVDQVKLAKAAMEQPVFREVSAMMSYDDYQGVNHSNWNRLVGRNGVVGIKTGTTTSALGNLVFAAKQDVGGETRTIVGAVVRQPAGGEDNTILGAALYESDRLIRAAQEALESMVIIEKGEVVGYVDDGLGGRTPVVTTRDVEAAGWPGLTVKLTFAAADVPHTAKAGTEVGTLTVGDGATSGAVEVPVALAEDLVEPGFTPRLTRLG
nr:D-alanyl-D-alanine carboxypeptidase [Streptomyces sp. HSG2]